MASVALTDLYIYGCANPGDSDADTAIGGAIDKALLPYFSDIGAAYRIVSENSGDTTQTVTTTYRDSGGNQQTEQKTLNGQSYVNFTNVPERILKAVKSATCAGAVGLMLQTPTRSNTAQGGAAGYITLDAGASGSNNAYRGYALRTTGGTGPNQIRRIVYYIGALKRAYVQPAFSVNPSSDTTFDLSPGIVCDKTPNEITTAYRLFLSADADEPGGSARAYYDKCFFWNNHGSVDLILSVVKEITDSLGIFDFALEASLDGTTTNGGGNNRLVAPGGLTFNSSDKNVANSQSLTHGAGQAVWGKLSLAAGADAGKATWSVELFGKTI